VPVDSGFLNSLLDRFRMLREESDVSRGQLEQRLILGPGWIERFETGQTMPTLDMLLAMLAGINCSLNDLLTDLPPPSAAEIDRYIHSERKKNSLDIHFKYAKYDAVYTLPNARTREFERVMKMLRDGLARLEGRSVDSEAVKAQAVTQAYLEAVRLWPDANPSDLWYFVIYRAYCDPFNHPARFARLDLSQSWKRTGGWALEQVLVRHYGGFLKDKGISLVIGSSEFKRHHLQTLRVKERLEADKIDLLLFGRVRRTDVIFGAVHVKASFAERRTDDVPMSRALVEGGYVSPLCTMDCKSSPSARPFNKGELGALVKGGDKVDRRSAKRKDIEEDGYFSACFSYNQNTRPTPTDQKVKARIYVCDFQNPDDAFSQFLASAWRRFRRS
jgi:transcriptional regulator with XRE-family HTH domain